jgi:hypothetical protein
VINRLWAKTNRYIEWLSKEGNGEAGGDCPGYPPEPKTAEGEVRKAITFFIRPRNRFGYTY